MLTKTMGTKVIGATFKQGRFAIACQRFFNDRQIAVIKLLLKVFSTGGDYGFTFCKQHWRQISEGFTGSGTGFNDHAMRLVNGTRYGFRHIGLCLSGLKPVYRLC